MEVNARIERKVKREEQRLMELKQRAKPLTPTPDRDPKFVNQHLNSLAKAYAPDKENENGKWKTEKGKGKRGKKGGEKGKRKEKRKRKRGK